MDERRVVGQIVGCSFYISAQCTVQCNSRSRQVVTDWPGLAQNRLNSYGVSGARDKKWPAGTVYSLKQLRINWNLQVGTSKPTGHTVLVDVRLELPFGEFAFWCFCWCVLFFGELAVECSRQLPAEQWEVVGRSLSNLNWCLVGDFNFLLLFPAIFSPETNCNFDIQKLLKLYWFRHRFHIDDQPKIVDNLCASWFALLVLTSLSSVPHLIVLAHLERGKGWDVLFGRNSPQIL